MDKRIQRLKRILLDTVPFFFPENGFGDMSLEDVLMAHQTPSVRALDFIECCIASSGDESPAFGVDAPQDLFYAQHKRRIRQIDDLVYAKFMSKKMKETVFARSSLCFGREGPAACVEKIGGRHMAAVSAPDTCGMALHQARTEHGACTSSGAHLMPFSLKRPEAECSAPACADECEEHMLEGTAAKVQEPNMQAGGSICGIKDIVRSMLVGGDTKTSMQLLHAALSSTYLSSKEIVELCDFSFDVLHSDSASLLQVYFLLLDRVDRTELPATLSPMLNLVESHLFGGTNLHHIFRVFRKVHPPKVLNLLELVLKKIYEIDVGIKLVALDILLREKSTPAFFEELVSLYDHLDTRKVEGMEFRHFAIIKCFSQCIVSGREAAGGSGGSAPSAGAGRRDMCAPSCVFSEDSYIRCTNTVFAPPENSCLRGLVASCLKRLRTCGLSRTFVVAFTVFNINKLRPTKKCPSAFLLSVFGKFLGMTHGLKERIFETTEEEVVYRGILKLDNTGESLAYVARAVFMFLLRVLKRSKSVRRGYGALRRPEVQEGGSVPETRTEASDPSTSACAAPRATHSVGKVIRTLLKADVEYIALAPREKIAAAEILKAHFPHQSPFVRELIVAFLDALGYHNTFSLLKDVAGDTSTAIRKKVFERLLRFAGDPEKLPDIVGVYFALLREKCPCDVKFPTQALARPFYFEEEKEIARYFHLSDTSIDTLEKAVLVKHYAKYRPEEVNPDAVVCVLDDVEMVKVKKNSEYVNTVLKIAANLLAQGGRDAAKCPMGRGLRKRLEAFCSQFVFYDVYVFQCAKVLRLLGYTSLGGSGDYYTLINACLGNRVEAWPSTTYGKKALVAFLDNHPEEIRVLRRQVADLLKDTELLPDVLKLLLVHIHAPETAEGPQRAPLEAQRSSTTAELYFNFVSTHQECIFAIADAEHTTNVLVLAYRLLARATHIGAVLSQLSVPRILRIMYRCESLRPDRVVMLYARDIINTLQDTLGLLLGTEPTQKEGAAHAQHSTGRHSAGTARRCILGEIFSAIRGERERCQFVEKLVLLANTENVFHIARALVRLDLSAKEARALDACMKEAMQSMLLTESAEMANLHNVVVAYVLGGYRNMLRTRKQIANLEEAERLAGTSEYTECEMQFILGLGSPDQIFV